ncbi:transmembrane protein 53 isoform X2 [Tribolium castaneum]|uniref:transmembrane protein 53 isoform X2 n=1 Tax=Tribolium castaneum TaxID=7070 RepID=UPI00077DB6AB|nr:PREDICTED: transmembrane protein 53 isoform X2 [Tribolium castaneum]|eukprot:XP_015836233.1 PREDICTED: transmembrane protein 53 isoform X2 [Tribolium castaneum]
MAGAADLDNLEYYIKFPSPNFNYSQPNGTGESDYVFVVNEEKIPVILLFGWAGCQDKYLAKYSQIYEDRGLITLRYTAPVKCLFWKRLQMITIGERLVKLLVDLNFENHPIIVHCFSNGGAFLYQNFTLALEKSPKPIQVVSNYISPKKTFQSNPLENLKDDKNNCPQHFIYSKKDILIPYTDIEYFANYRKSLGIDVTTLCYETSPHVKHYTENKESYVSSVCNFLNKCLNGTN